MLAVVFNGPYDVSVETVPEPRIERPDDAIVHVGAAAVCGSDLWTYRGQAPVAPGSRIGHEFLGCVAEVGPQVSELRVGDWVVAPFRYSDGDCEFCAEGLTSSCLRGGFWSREVKDAGQGEFVRVPFADATLVKLNANGSAPDHERIPDLLTLADVMPTGMHAVTKARVGIGSTVVVVGDGAVGQCAIIASRLAGARRILVLGGDHADRRNLAKKLGADDFTSARGKAAVAEVTEWTSGRLAEHVVECVGSEGSFSTALSIVRAGGTVGYVGLPHGVHIELAQLFNRNVNICGGMCPARYYMPGLLAMINSGKIRPGMVFTHSSSLVNAPEAYRLMDHRETIKVLLATS